MDIQVKNKSYSICIFLKELLIIFICTKGTRTFKNIVMDAFWGIIQKFIPKIEREMERNDFIIFDI